MSNPESDSIRSSLPVFDNHHGSPEGWPGLAIDGLVQNPTVLTASELAELTTNSMTDDFRCLEGWSVPDQNWEGVPLAALLQIAQPLPDARYAAISADGYTVAIPLDENLPNVLLATRLNGSELPPAHGGPCRLVRVEQACYASIKWVDNIRLTRDMPEETARDIAGSMNANREATTP